MDLPTVESERDLLPFALQLARGLGDADPCLIQHATTTRAAAADVLGWRTCEQSPVWVVVIQGQFTVTHRRRQSKNGQTIERPPSAVPVLFRVISIETGRTLDAGAKRTMPDLAPIAPITTDFRSEP